MHSFIKKKQARIDGRRTNRRDLRDCRRTNHRGCRHGLQTSLRGLRDHRRNRRDRHGHRRDRLRAIHSSHQQASGFCR